MAAASRKGMHGWSDKHAQRAVGPTAAFIRAVRKAKIVETVAIDRL